MRALAAFLGADYIVVALCSASDEILFCRVPRKICYSLVAIAERRGLKHFSESDYAMIIAIEEVKAGCGN